MRAARLLENRTELTVMELPELEIRPASVIVRIESVFAPGWLQMLVDGSAGFTTPARPFTPGQDSVGIIEQVADDVFDLNPGTMVFCDSYVEWMHPGRTSDRAFIGCFPLTPRGGRILEVWPDGPLASHMVLPAECVTPVDAALPNASPEILCRLGWFGTAHGAIEKTGFAPGDSVAVLGATGQVGVSAVLVALAMGAGRVVAVGRSPEKLSAFEGLDPRVETTTLFFDASAPVDVVVSALSDDTEGIIEKAIGGLVRYGTLVIVESPGTPFRIGAPLTYNDIPDWLVYYDITIRGSLWFPRATIGKLVTFIANGSLPVDRIRSHRYALDEANAALAHSAKGIAPFEQVVVCPGG